ncbi:MAG TPA: outer membrane beta-barrel protein [Candidatus Krumholzibacteria bacterium]|nr:outer membrane beta-barrel protein [Candidatus Krumholzibacteria bacterium]
MKRIAFVERLALAAVAGVLLSAASLAHAEGGYAGFKLGANLASFTGDDADLYPDSRTGFTGGGFIGIDSGRYLGFRTDLLYTMKGGANDVVTIEIDYLEVAPLLVGRYDLPNRFALRAFAGPVFGFWINAEADNRPMDIDIGDIVHHFELSGTIGAELDVQAGPYIGLVEVRYTQGGRVFEDVGIQGEPLDLKVSNRGISVMAGLMCPF